MDDSAVRKDESEVARVVRRVDWVVVASSSLAFGWDAQDDDARETRGDASNRGEVWVAMSRWKSSVGSESMVSTSESRSWPWSFSARFGEITLGMWLTLLSSLALNLARLASALLARSWRDDVRDCSIGWMRYLLAP